MIPYGRHRIARSDVEAVVEALESDYLTGGPRVAELERALCDATGARFAIACSSGTAALHLACLALGVSSGDRGVTSPITFLASANCLEYCGASADFVDIDDSLCIDVASLERYCLEVAIPKVVIPVDFAGMTARLGEIHELSRKYGFKIIEDAAHSIGSRYTYSGREFSAGQCVHSDAAIFSFHPVKTVTTAEGGAVLTNDEELARSLGRLRSHGIRREGLTSPEAEDPWYYEMDRLGFNYRMTDVQAALGGSQMRSLESFKTERARLAGRYRELLAGDPRVILPPRDPACSPCPHLFVVQFTEGAGARRRVYEALLAAGFQTQVHYIPVYWQPYYRERYGYAKGKCPKAELYYSRCLSLPLFPGLPDSDQSAIVETLIEAL